MHKHKKQYANARSGIGRALHTLVNKFERQAHAEAFHHVLRIREHLSVERTRANRLLT